MLSVYSGVVYSGISNWKTDFMQVDAGLMYQYSFTVYKHLKLNMQGTFSGVKASYNNNGKQKHSVDNDIIFCFTF